MLRFIFSLIFVVLFLILTIPLMLIEWIISKWNRKRADFHSMKIVRFAFRTIIFLSGVHLDVTGLEGVPPDEACLFVGNHRGFFDVAATYALTKRPMGFVAKIEMKKIPLLNVWMYRIRCLFLDRSNIREGLKMVLAGVAQIKEGVSIFIFPEGTRSKEDKMLPFKEGALKIADKSDCLIIPVAIQGSSAIFDDHLPFIKKGTITLQYGTPIRPSELSKEQRKFLGSHVQEIIKTMLGQ